MGIPHNVRTNGFAIDFIIICVLQEINKDFFGIMKKPCSSCGKRGFIRRLIQFPKLEVKRDRAPKTITFDPCDLTTILCKNPTTRDQV